MALPAKNRLPLRSERERITREGKTFHTQFFTIVMAPIPPARLTAKLSAGRFAVLLSKKTAKLAVDRNLIKRRVSACIQELLLSFAPADYLIIPKRSVLEATHSSLLSDIESFLRRQESIK